MKQISVVISAYNEELKIKQCLESIKWADEIIFIDNSSTDKTVAIAKKYTSKIFIQPNNLMLNINKNFGFTKVKNDWILSLDSDERVTPELAEEIKSITYSDQFDGFWIPRKNIIFGKWIKSEMWWPDYQLRLFKKEKGKFDEKHVHELLRVDGEVKKLNNALIHENYGSVSQYIQKMDKIYTENETNIIVASGKKLTWVDAIRFPVNDFLKTFFLQKGYKDGLHGLVLSFLQAFYMEVVFTKVWEQQGFKEQHDGGFLKDVYRVFKKSCLEFEYWFLTALINETENPLKKNTYRFLRRRKRKKIDSISFDS